MYCVVGVRGGGKVVQSKGTTEYGIECWKAVGGGVWCQDMEYPNKELHIDYSPPVTSMECFQII